MSSSATWPELGVSPIWTSVVPCDVRHVAVAPATLAARDLIYLCCGDTMRIGLRLGQTGRGRQIWRTRSNMSLGQPLIVCDKHRARVDEVASSIARNLIERYSIFRNRLPASWPASSSSSLSVLRTVRVRLVYSRRSPDTPD